MCFRHNFGYSIIGVECGSFSQYGTPVRHFKCALFVRDVCSRILVYKTARRSQTCSIYLDTISLNFSCRILSLMEGNQDPSITSISRLGSEFIPKHVPERLIPIDPDWSRNHSGLLTECQATLLPFPVGINFSVILNYFLTANLSSASCKMNIDMF